MSNLPDLKRGRCVHSKQHPLALLLRDYEVCCTGGCLPKYIITATVQALLPGDTFLRSHQAAKTNGEQVFNRRSN